MAAEQHSIASYVSSKRGEPGVFEKIDMTLPNTNNIRKKMVVHAIVRCDENGEHISPEDQVIGAFTGFMHSISPPAERSKAYYFLTLPKSPSKKVVFTMMENDAEAFYSVCRGSTSLRISGRVEGGVSKKNLVDCSRSHTKKVPRR